MPCHATAPCCPEGRIIGDVSSFARDGLAAIEDLLTAGRVQACMPPHVPVPRPGRCPKNKTDTGIKEIVKKVAEPKKAATPKVPAKKAVAKKATPAAKPTPAPEPPKALAGIPGQGKSERVLQAEAHVADLTAKLPPALRKDVADALNMQAAIAPKAVLSLRHVGFDVGRPGRTSWDGEFAEYYGPRRSIQLNPGWKTRRATFTKVAESSQKDGYLTPTGSTPLGGVIAHEFGHHVAHQGLGKAEIGLDKPYGEQLLNDLSTALGITPPPVKPGGRVVPRPLINKWLESRASIFARHISEYSSDSISELLAEAWQEYSTRGDAARPYAKAVGQVMRTAALSAKNVG